MVVTSAVEQRLISACSPPAFSIPSRSTTISTISGGGTWLDEPMRLLLTRPKPGSAPPLGYMSSAFAAHSRIRSASTSCRVSAMRSAAHSDTNSN